MGQRLSACLLAALLFAGCSGDEPPLALESEHFRLYAYPDDPVCPRFLEGAEQHYRALGPYLGIALEEGAKFEIYKYANEAALTDDSPCPDAAHGCAGDGRLYVATLMASPFEHELVHAYASIAGNAPPLFEEGLAMMLQDWDGLGIGEKPPHFGATPLEGAADDEGWRAAGEPYGAAGSFTRYLADTYGIAGFEAVRRDLARDASTGDVDATFGAALGVPFASAVSAWRSGPALSGWLPVADCAAPALPTDASSTLGELVCGRARRAFELPSAAGLVVRVHHASHAGVNVLPCAGGRPLWPSDWSVSTFYPAFEQRELWASLPAGRYGLEASAFSPGPEANPLIAFEWARPVGDRCEDTSEQGVPDETRAVEVPLDFAVLADDGGEALRRDAFVRFRVESARNMAVTVSPADVFAPEVFEDGADHATRRWLCAGGCPASGCVELTSAKTTLAAGQAVTLVLEGGPTDRRTFEIALE